MLKMTTTNPLAYKVIAKCSTTKARVGLMSLVHSDVSTPVFLPVGTQGTLKGMLPDQLIELNCQIMLGNTYHLGMRPVSLFDPIKNWTVPNQPKTLTILGNRNSQESWWPSQVYELAKGTIDRFGWLSNGVTFAIGRDKRGRSGI